MTVCPKNAIVCDDVFDFYWKQKNMKRCAFDAPHTMKNKQSVCLPVYVFCGLSNVADIAKLVFSSFMLDTSSVFESKLCHFCGACNSKIIMMIIVVQCHFFFYPQFNCALDRWSDSETFCHFLFITSTVLRIHNFERAVGKVQFCAFSVSIRDEFDSSHGKKIQ